MAPSRELIIRAKEVVHSDRGCLSPEAARKTTHLIAGLLPLMYAYGVSRGTMLGLLGIASMVALVAEWARRAWPSVESLFERMVGPMFREHERRAITGATWLVLVSTSAVAVLPARPAIAVLWCTTVADPTAGLVGRAWRSHTRSGTGKTVAGSLACAVVAFTGLSLLADFTSGPALAIALAAALAERFPGPFDDNVTIGVGAALLASAVA